MTLPQVDWTRLHRFPPQTITCRCGAVYRTYCKVVQHDGRLCLVTELPCPACTYQIDHVVRAESEPERMTISADEIGSATP